MEGTEHAGALSIFKSRRPGRSMPKPTSTASVVFARQLEDKAKPPSAFISSVFSIIIASVLAPLTRKQNMKSNTGPYKVSDAAVFSLTGRVSLARR